MRRPLWATLPCQRSITRELISPRTAAPIDRLAILRIDADLYGSTMDVLQALCGRVSPGGFVIIDDYHVFEPCRRAVDEFRSSRAIDAALWSVDANRVYWRVPA